MTTYVKLKQGIYEVLEIIIMIFLTSLILSYPDWTEEVILFFGLPLSFCVFLHELSHKIVAIKRGKIDVRIKASIPGLLFGLLLTFRTHGSFTFFLPGYVEYEETDSFSSIFRKDTKREIEVLESRAIIAMSGPLINSIIAVLCFLSLLALKIVYGSFERYLICNIDSYILFFLPLTIYTVSHFNAMLTLINLIPIPLPFFITDGFHFLSSYIDLRKRNIKKVKLIILLILTVIGALLFVLYEIFGLLGNELLSSYDKILGT